MLIIYAHPNKTGHCGLMLEEVKLSLDKKKINYDILDLYEMKYDPVLTNEEHYTSEHYNISESNKKIQEQIKAENKFIFIYPTWWNSAPAILKGFIDRIFVKRFAFKYEGKIPKGLLNGKAVIFTSTGGPRLLTKLYYKDGIVKFLTRDVLSFCGIKAKGFVVDNASTFNDAQKLKVKKKIIKGLDYLM